MAHISVFTGRFGSGKTEVSINYALRLASGGADVTLVDLDVVTPYFRSRDMAENLAVHGVRVVAPVTHGRYSEPVGLTAAILGAIQDESRQVVLDVGGDAVGAKVLGRYAGYLTGLGYEMNLVVNPFRPAASTAPAIASTIAGIERSSRLHVSSLVSNPNLMEETTKELVLQGHPIVLAAAKALGLPVPLLCVEASLTESTALRSLAPDVLPIYRHLLPPWNEQQAYWAGNGQRPGLPHSD